MNKLLKRITALACSAVLTISAVPTAFGESEYVLPKQTSSVTIDYENSGYARGIWGNVTVGWLKGQFEGNVSIRRGGKILSTGDSVASDDIVYGGKESYPVIIYGDCNRDSKVNLSDVSALLMTIAKWDVDICTAAADVSLNDRCDLADATELLKWIAGWDITLADSVFPKTELSLGSGYSVVVPDDADEFELLAAEYLCKALDSVYGTRTGKNRIIDDTQTVHNEILIGNTSRSRTAESKAGLGDFDWTYTIPTDKRVVITGKDSIGTYEAVRAFVWDNFGYVNDHNTVTSYSVWNGSGYTDVTTGKTVFTGLSKTFRYTPSEEPLQFGGRNAAEFDIVSKYPDDAATKLMQRTILRETGIKPDVVKYGEEDSSPAIRLGVGKKDGTSYAGVTSNIFAMALDGGNVVIDVPSYRHLLYATQTFSKQYVEKRLPLGEVAFGGAGSNDLMPVSKTDTEIADGITYSQIKFEDVRNQPVLAYLVTVENGADRVIMGTPNNGTVISGVKATVLDAIKAAEADGFDIAAGINADFFNIGSDYSPVGLCVKDGVILKGNDQVKPWIAVMNDGTMDCGVAGEARSKISKMKHGFGASHVILKNGSEYQTDVSSSFAEIRHPRTAMGYDSDGNVYLLVVDGRRPKLSNGASLLDLAVILKNAGAESAVNLDGGGSSAMVVDDGGFKTKNSPSDGALRKVFNSVLIVK